MTTLPEPTELEVSLFGPGFGECAVIHLGDGQWMVVDSCLDAAASNLPVALAYLKDIGVEAAQILLVVATHFDTDHIRGLSLILEAAPTARFVCSAAVSTKQFLELAAANARADPEESPTGEMYSILKLLQRRSDLYTRIVTPDFAKSGTTLYRREQGTVSCEVIALSPSSATMAVAHLRTAAALARPGELKLPKRLPVADSNGMSVALWIRVGGVTALLGADLEQTAADDEGWKGVVGSPVRPVGRADVFKIPHHGSITGHSDEVWSEMLSPGAVATIAPFNAGAKRLPAQTDLARLLRFTPYVYVTGLGLAKKPHSRPSTVERMIAATVRERRVIGADMGHVRVRLATVGKPSVTLTGPAYAATA